MRIHLPMVSFFPKCILYIHTENWILSPSYTHTRARAYLIGFKEINNKPVSSVKQIVVSLSIDTSDTGRGCWRVWAWGWAGISNNNNNNISLQKPIIQWPLTAANYGITAIISANENNQFVRRPENIVSGLPLRCAHAGRIAFHTHPIYWGSVRLCWKWRTVFNDLIKICFP